MDWIDALILGIIQGLTEFLPISSSGHLELGNGILKTDVSENLTFAIIVHGATVLSTIAVFYKDIGMLLKDLFLFRWNESTRYVLKLIISAIPVAIIGLLWKDSVEALFTGNIVLVGSMLLVTAALLTFAYFSKDRGKEFTYLDSIIIGIGQALAVMPGISRAGATISTGMMLGNKRENVARFSFLMVLLPIIGANGLDLISGKTGNSGISLPVLLVGFATAFVTGYFACRFMINIVKKGKIIWFAVYCAIVGFITIIVGL
ncbi:MAG: undecaprenyl-diphosphate phosphatase [Bacteroidota bacterium]